jgi:hypothetical protein
MNKARRKILDGVIKTLEEIKPKLEDARDALSTEAEGERETYDNMPENMQSGDKGQACDNAATNLEDAHTALNEIDIDDLIGKINEAQGS